MKDFIRSELGLVHTFVGIARRRYLLGDVRGGDASRNHAEKAYHLVFQCIEKSSIASSSERREFAGLAQKAKESMETLPKRRRRAK